MKRFIILTALLASSANAQIPRSQECFNPVGVPEVRGADLRFLGGASTIDFSGAGFVPLAAAPIPVGYVTVKIDGVPVLVLVSMPDARREIK